MHTRSPERPKRSKQTNQPAPYPAEATNQAATYRFPSEQISPCTPKNFYLFIDSVHINAKKPPHILSKGCCHMWRQCTRNKAYGLFINDKGKMYFVMGNGPCMDQLSFFREKNWTRDL
jgi:hypothetical protein